LDYCTRNGGEFHPPSRVKGDRHPQESQLTGRRASAWLCEEAGLRGRAIVRPVLPGAARRAGLGSRPARTVPWPRAFA
jgi:hypothetical protein